MAGSTGDSRKWHLPGWRIEQRYAPGVLIGNWSEERLAFQKYKYDHNSTNRIDFRNFGSHRPDVLIRRKGERANMGLPAEIFFHHHGNRYTNNMVSWYDEDYNGRFREKTLPPLNREWPPRREWDSHALAWRPEKSDHPVSAPPTNFGLLGKMQRRWAAQIADETRGDYQTTYMAQYDDFPQHAMVGLRYATPKDNSTIIHPVNKTLKDWHLRNGSHRKSPEKLPAEMIPTGNLPEPIGVGTMPPVCQ
ncbi:hypothetical protein BaRGS_00032766 [Batillaria attramentaria]|uniref:Uncharacterized protein n=1 Tax=Batillaria attramentaria TaxID=370345 RepID=A0ABD0JLY1_9CAEN